MAISLILLPATLTLLLLSPPQSNALISSIDTQTVSSCSNQQNENYLASELEETKLRIARLESIFGERIGDVNAKNDYIKEYEKKIEALTEEIDRLKTEFKGFGNDYSRSIEKIRVLEEEVRLLWTASRQHNFEIHALEYKAEEAEKKVKEITSKVEKTSEIVSEQWIQIQQLEQAMHATEMRMAKVRYEIWRRCPFVKYLMDLYDDCLKVLEWIFNPYMSRLSSVLLFCKSRALQIWSNVKEYHHQLQFLVKQAMKRHELTAAFAHEEVVFFVASALVTFPIMYACMFLRSHLN